MNTSETGAYSKPELNRIGSFEEITLAGATGEFTDAEFPDNTPKSQLTFS